MEKVNLSKPSFMSPLISTGSKLIVSVIMVIMIISSPVFMLVNPTQVLAATTTSDPNNIDTSNHHSNLQAMQAYLASISTIPNATMAPPMSSLDSDFTTQAALSLLRATQTDNLVNSKTYYDLSFRTATAGVIKTIQMAFPPGTSVGSAVLIEAVGIGSGTIAASGSVGTGQTLTYTVTNEVNVPALTRMRIQVANVNNPPDPSNSLTVTITTRDSANNIIDGPTPTNAYNIKQIGTTEIANDAVTLPKIASGSVVTDTNQIETFTDLELVPPGQVHAAIAECPPNFFVTGGGFGSTNDGTLVVLGSFRTFPPEPEGWEVTAFNTGTDPELAIQAVAECQELVLNP
jgi:hypothetical protein